MYTQIHMVSHENRIVVEKLLTVLVLVYANPIIRNTNCKKKKKKEDQYAIL